MYESGEREPKYELLTAIAAHYEVDLDYLLGRDRPESESEDPDLRMIARAGRKMTPERRKDMLRLLKIAFPEEFRDDDGA